MVMSNASHCGAVARMHPRGEDEVQDDEGSVVEHSRGPSFGLAVGFDLGSEPGSFALGPGPGTFALGSEPGTFGFAFGLSFGFAPGLGLAVGWLVRL